MPSTRREKVGVNRLRTVCSKVLQFYDRSNLARKSRRLSPVADMADKQNFTPDEWTKVLESVMLASMAVTAAEPGGLWGTLMETFAGGLAMGASKFDPSAKELIKAVIADFETPQGRFAVQEALRKGFAGAKPVEVVRRSLTHLREVAAILDAKAPDDAAAVKAWLQGISQRVAEASKEGSFLGFGGVQVSDAEKATLADISKALGTSA